MELRQLRYVLAVYEHACNVSLASRQLRTSQPGLSRQIRLLEKEVGFPIFDRSQPNRPRPTQAGKALLSHAENVLREANLLRQECEEVRAPVAGSLSVAASDPEVRELLPAVVAGFTAGFPDVSLHLHQASPEQSADLLRRGRVDLAMATYTRAHDESLLWLPCYRWHHRLIVPDGHALAEIERPAFSDLARYPLVTTPYGPAGRPALESAFEAAQLTGRVVMTALGRDVIETYVLRGIGIGIVASVAGPAAPGLRAIDASHLFDAATTWAAVARVKQLRGYVYAFMEVLAPHLTREVIAECVACGTQEEVDHALADLYVRLLV